MAIENLGQSEEINIKNISEQGESKASSAIFDPERDLRPIDKESAIFFVKSMLEKDQSKFSCWDFFRFAYAVWLTFPNEFDQEIDIDEWHQNELFEYARTDTNTRCRIFELTVLEAICPKNFEKVKITEKQRESLENAYKITRGAWERKEMAAYMKILSPEMFKELKIEVNRTSLKEIIDIYKERNEPKEIWFPFASVLANAKILDPKSIEGLISEDDWIQMKKFNQEFENKDNEDWIEHAAFIANLKILAAKEIKIGKRGLEIILPEQKDELNQRPEIPVSRNY